MTPARRGARWRKQLGRCSPESGCALPFVGAKRFVSPAASGYKFGMAEQTEPPAEPIRFATNIIAQFPDAPGGSRFVNAGEDSPYRSIDEVPINLRPLIVTGELEPEEENAPRGAFQLNTPYETTPDGRLGRQLRRRIDRQVAALEAEEELTEWIEAESERPLPPEVAESLQAEHEAHVAQQAAEMGAAARMSDAIADAAIAAQEPPELFVKRGGRHYAPAHKARLKPGEDVFMKDPDDGTFQFIGTCDSRGDLPDAPITIL